jgi:hypothetical protein
MGESNALNIAAPQVTGYTGSRSCQVILGDQHMAKKNRPAEKPNPAIRLSGLPTRLERLFMEQTDPAELGAALDRLTDGLKPTSFLPLLVGAFAAAPDSQRALLDEPVSTWLREHGLLTVLRDLELRHLPGAPEREMMRAWLAAGGIAPLSSQDLNPVDRMIAAYEVSDEAQASVTLFYFVDGRRRRVRISSFLIDFQPPWEGALKDLAYRSFPDAERARDEYFAVWEENIHEQRPIAVTDATRRVWTALRQSQAQGIRLPADFVAVMGEVVPFLLALPVDPEAPALTPDEIKALASTGRKPEDIVRDERLFGYQQRLPDGSILRILRPPDDDW